jgi:hypothetical protein
MVIFSLGAIAALVSCNKGNSRETVDAAVHLNAPPEASETPVKSFSYSAKFDTVRREGIINRDCEYYNKYTGYGGGGKLTKGEKIIIFLGRTNNFGANYIDENDIWQIDIRVEAKKQNDEVSIWVDEHCITYDDERYNAWFKNVLLVREYYYTGTPEYIFNADNAFFRNNWDNWEKTKQNKFELERVMESWLPDPSREGGNIIEQKMRISENYLMLERLTGSKRFFRIYSISKDGNVYTLYLIETFGSEVEITLIDDKDGITITECVIKERGDPIAEYFTFIQDLLNIKYVPYNKGKSEKSRKAVYAWINKQLEILRTAHE